MMALAVMGCETPRRGLQADWVDTEVRGINLRCRDQELVIGAPAPGIVGNWRVKNRHCGRACRSGCPG